MNDFNLSGEYHADCNMLMQQVEQLQQRIVELEQRNNELAEMVEEFREEVSTAIEIIEDSGMDYDEIVAAKEQDDEL